MDELKAQLTRWGSIRQTCMALAADGVPRGTHMLEQARTLAPGTRERAERQLLGRDGRDRRRFMAQAVNGCGLRIIPMWACDPIPSRNDAGRPQDIRAVIEPEIPDELKWLDMAVSSIARKCPIRAEVLREEFTGAGTQKDKAKRLESQYGGKLSIDQYKRELRRALDCLGGMSRAAA